MNLDMNPNVNDPYMNPNETADHIRRNELKTSPEGIPLYPSETENIVLVARWQEAFEDYATTKELKQTLIDGKASTYPQYVTQACLSADTAVKKRGDEAKKDLDKVANTKLYGQLRLATRESAPSLYAQLRSDVDGDGKAAFTWLTTRVTTSSLADAHAAQEVRDSWAKTPTPRYLLTSEWDAKLTNYDKLNKACGDFEVTGKQVVFAYYNMLPASFRAAHYLTIDSELATAKAKENPAHARTIFRKFIQNDRTNGQKAHHDQARMAQQAMAAHALAGHRGQVPNEAFAAFGGHNPSGDEAFAAFRGRVPPTSAGTRPPTESMSVSQMSKEERLRRLREMDPCSVCHKKHFGPTGPGRCAADPSVPLPPMFQSKTTPARYAYVMALRRGERALVAAPVEDECHDALDDYELASSATETPGDTTAPAQPPGQDPEPAAPEVNVTERADRAEDDDAFATHADTDLDPFEAMRRDMQAEHGYSATDDFKPPATHRPAKAKYFLFAAACLVLGVVLGRGMPVANSRSDATARPFLGHGIPDANSRSAATARPMNPPGAPPHPPHQTSYYDETAYVADLGQTRLHDTLGFDDYGMGYECSEAWASGTPCEPEHAIPLGSASEHRSDAAYWLPHLPDADQCVLASRAGIACVAGLVAVWTIVTRHLGLSRRHARRFGALLLLALPLLFWHPPTMPCSHDAMARTIRPIHELRNTDHFDMSVRSTEMAFNASKPPPVHELRNAAPSDVSMRSTELAFNASKPGLADYISWAVIDSGATSIALIHKAFFDYITPVHGKYMKIANGALIPIEGVGPATFYVTDARGVEHVIRVKRALYVPRFAGNLLSVHSLWQNDGIDVVFRDTNALILPGWTGKKVYFGSSPYSLAVRPAGALSTDDAMTSSRHKATQGKHSTQAKMADPELMHSRLMHGGEETLRSVARTCEDAEHLSKCVLKACPTCLRANARRQAARGAVPTPEQFGWVSFDIAGPYLHTWHFRQQYLMAFRDLHTGLLWGYLLRSRDEAPQTIRQFLADSATHGKVVRFHSDNEFRSAAIESITLDRGIKHTFITPHEPRQNSASERMFGAIFEKVRASLAEGNVPRSLWGHAALQAIDVLNRTRVVRDGQTGWQIGYGKKARIGHLRPMYCRAWLKLPPPDLPRSAKIHDRGIMCIHLGSDGLGYKLLVIGWNAIRVSANVTFEEDVFPGLSTGPLVQGGSSAPAQGGITPTPETHEDDNDQWDIGYTPQDTEAPQGTHTETLTETPQATRQQPGRAEEPIALRLDADLTDPAEPTNTEPQYISQRLTRNRTPTPHAYQCDEDHEIGFNATGPESAFTESALNALNPEPKSRPEMLARPPPERKGWIAAEGKELKNHENNGTFRDTVPITHVDKTKVINSTWAYKNKTGDTGELDKRKARLATADIKGLKRHENEDFQSSFSSGMSMTSFRCIIALAAYYGFPVYQLDFTGAYLQKPVPADKKIYVRCAPGYVEHIQDKWGNKVEAVKELGKYMYGLQEAGAEWMVYLADYLKNDCRFTQSWVDPNVYYRDTPEGRVIIGVYVDDLIIVAPNKATAAALEAVLAKQFVFEAGEPAHLFLGANISRVSRHVYQVSHTAYIRKMAKSFGVRPSSRAETPSKANIKSLIDELEDTKKERTIDPKITAAFRSRVGSALYSARAVRIDIGYVVGMLCRCLTYADERALRAVDDCLAYVAANDDLALVYDGSQGLHIDAYTDADWSVGPSTTGYVIFLCGAPVAWRSIKQKSTSMSSCESELIAANAAGSECVHVKNLVSDITGIPVSEPTLRCRLGCDNQGTIAVAKNPAVSRIKHIQRDYLKIREWIAEKIFRMEYVPSNRNPADLLTKYLCPSAFLKLRAKLMRRTQVAS